MAKVKKAEKENVKIPDYTVEAFSPADFTQPYPTSSSNDVPMWWKVAETPSLTYSEYKKNKKRKERHAKQLEDYLVKLAGERNRHAERLKAEEERYGEELRVKDEAYKAKAKQYELELAIEAEKREKKLLEEIEEIRKKAREEELIREVERTRRLDEEKRYKLEQRKKSAEAKARIEKERLEAESEALRIKAEAEAEKERKRAERRVESARIKDVKLQQEIKEAEEANAEKLRLAEEEAKRVREEQARLDEEMRLEAERVQAEIAERERVKREHKKEEDRRQKEAVRIETLRAETEKKTIASLKRAHKLRDVEFVYPIIEYKPSDDKYLLKTKNLHLADKSGEALSKNFNLSFTSGFSVVGDCKGSDMHDLCSLVTRDFGRDLLSGGLKIGNVFSHKMTKRDYDEWARENLFVLPYAVEENIPTGSVKKYVERSVPVEKTDEMRRYLSVLGVKASEVEKRSFSALNLATATKVMIACALAGAKKVMIFFEPGRTLDMPSKTALVELLKEWGKAEREQLLCVFTGDKAGAK